MTPMGQTNSNHGSLNRARALAFVWRFSLVATILAGLSLRFGADIAEQLLPAFRHEFGWLQDTYRVNDLYIDRSSAGEVIHISVGIRGCLVLDDKAFCGADPRAQANASTMVANITMPAVLFLSLLATWPTCRRQEYFVRLLIAPFALALVWALDIPLFIWAAFWGLHVDALAPGMFSPLLVWSAFLEGGGRMVLAGVGGVWSILLARGLRA